MKTLCCLAVAAVALLALVSCESTNYGPPPVTAQMAKTGSHRVTMATLQEGRNLYVSRCIECHTLPVVSRYPAAQWPRIVDEMAERASLQPAQHNAVLAYILAAHAQPK